MTLDQDPLILKKNIHFGLFPNSEVGVHKRHFFMIMEQFLIFYLGIFHDGRSQKIAHIKKRFRNPEKF